MTKGLFALPIRSPQAYNEDEERERQRIQAALNQSGGRREEAARRLGVSRVTLWKRMKQLGWRPDAAAGFGHSRAP